LVGLDSPPVPVVDGSSPDRALSMLGMARRAGAVVTGTESVRNAIRASETGFVVVAADASPTQQRKLLPLLEARRIPYRIRFTRSELGGSVGRAPVTALLVTENGLASRIREMLE